MSGKLQNRLKQTKPISLSTETMLNILVAADYFRQMGGCICATEGINFTQYNILRILHGVYPAGHPRCEIRERLIERGSDITRHIDKLVANKLAERVASEGDKRLSYTRITAKGSEIMARLTEHIARLETKITEKLTEDECRQISDACEKIYEDL